MGLTELIEKMNSTTNAEVKWRKLWLNYKNNCEQEKEINTIWDKQMLLTMVVEKVWQKHFCVSSMAEVTKLYKRKNIVKLKWNVLDVTNRRFEETFNNCNWILDLDFNRILWNICRSKLI